MTRKNVQPELKDASKRNLFKYTLAAGASALVADRVSQAKSGRDDDDDDDLPAPPVYPPSPPVSPWREPIPPYTYRPFERVASLTPECHEFANLAAGECGRDRHQRWDEFYLGMPESEYDLYEFHVKEEKEHRFNPSYPDQPIWGFNGTYPGPTIHAHYGKTVMVRVFNELPQNHVGFGSPEISNHLHNLHTASESDGFPGDFFSPEKKGPTLSAPGTFKDHCYPNVYAGYEQSRQTDPQAIGDPREALGTLWYHDHTLDSTGANVVKGLAGFYLLYDELDSGNENDPNPAALHLPSGDYDVPLMLQDKRFDEKGFLFFDQLSPEGVLGDRVAVNGKIQPFFNVAARRYRFRILNGGPTRFYELYLVRGNRTVPFTYIANDGNLLPFPLVNQNKVFLAMAERADIIVDFSGYAPGTEIYLVNRMRQDDTRKPKDARPPGDQLLKFIVGPAVADPTPILTATTPLRELPPINLDEVVARRSWEFDRRRGLWTVNGKNFNVNDIKAKPKKGTAEIWTLRNDSGGWAHPVHIHLEEGRILTRNGRPPPPHERGRKDVYYLPPEGRLELFIRFRDFTGKYVMHCHNLVHEDHAMMVRWDVEADT